MFQSKKKTATTTTNYDAEVLDIEAKYFTLLHYNKFTGKMLDVKIIESLIGKASIALQISSYR